MVQTKFVSINCNNRSTDFNSVTNFSASDENDSETVATFDGVLAKIANDGGYELSLESYQLRGVSELITIKKILKDMRSIPGSLRVREVAQHKTGEIITEYDYTGVILTSREIEYDVEDLTTNKLEFVATDVVERVNGEIV